jgi:replication-associated recombination protein RarA
MAHSHRDPWVDVETKSGLKADQVISALQKEIRRSNIENACLLAYEMILTSPELEDYLWERLKIISVEDIGFGEPNAPVIIQNLYEMTISYDRSVSERKLFAIHAVRYLCLCQKDRSSDEMLNWIHHSYKLGKVRPSIPDYALDMHTAEGKKKGRGRRHFCEEGSQIKPELPGREKKYLERILEMLETGNIED